MDTTLEPLLATIGFFVCLGAIGRYGLIFMQDAYYDAMEHNRQRRRALTKDVVTMPSEDALHG